MKRRKLVDYGLVAHRKVFIPAQNLLNIPRTCSQEILMPKKPTLKELRKAKPKNTKLVKASLAKVEQRVVVHEARERTKAEIAAEIKRLKAMKPYVQKITFFGDNNHHAIEAQITTLKEGLDDDQIAKRFLPESGDGEPTEEECEQGRTVEVESAARGAINWRDGDNCQAEAPSDGWRPLAVKGGWKP